MPVRIVNGVHVVGDLNEETPYLQGDFDKTIDIQYVRDKAELISSFPSALDGPVDREARSYVIVALAPDGKKGYLWDVNEAENRENNYRRMRNGMNLSAFADCDFYFVSAPAEPVPGVFGVPAIDRTLYAPFFGGR